MKSLELFITEKIKRGYTSVETILHSDQGSVYASRAFQNAHQHYNIIRSMSRAKTPTDNPIIEALNGWMKNELYIDFDLQKTKGITKTIAEYVEYFNHERLSYRLKYKTPIQVKTELGVSKCIISCLQSLDKFTRYNTFSCNLIIIPYESFALSKIPPFSN